jgi:uncharacterized protein YecA (UPF0149 family)
MAGFAHDRIGPFTGAVEELEGWRLGEDEVPALSALADFEVRQPITNPLRKVGRNDPYPCGSGKKFKRCCMAA